MLISRVYRFVFVRGRKVGGTSVEMALSTLCREGDVATPMRPVDERERQRLGGYCGNYSNDPRIERAYLAALASHPGDMPVPTSRYRVHASLREIEQAYPASLAGFRVICVERNPYAKVISLLNMAHDYGEAPPASRIRSDFDRALGEGRIDALRTIDLYRNAERAVVAEPIHYERLQDDLDSFTRTIGISRKLVLPHAKKGLMSNRFAPEEMFDRDRLDRINQIFAEEFDRFGYRMI